MGSASSKDGEDKLFSPRSDGGWEFYPMYASRGYQVSAAQREDLRATMRRYNWSMLAVLILGMAAMAMLWATSFVSGAAASLRLVDQFLVISVIELIGLIAVMVGREWALWRLVRRSPRIEIPRSVVESRTESLTTMSKGRIILLLMAGSIMTAASAIAGIHEFATGNTDGAVMSLCGVVLFGCGIIVAASQWQELKERQNQSNR